MKCRKQTRIKVQILFGREIVKCNAINFSIKLDRAVTWIQVGGLNKLSNSLDRPRSAFWSFLHYYQGMHVGQPIFITENRKAAKRLQNKSSSSTWNFKSWRWGCGGLVKVGWVCSLKWRGRLLEIIEKMSSKEVQTWNKLGGGTRPNLIRIGAVG